jgi:hypothetical protein
MRPERAAMRSVLWCARTSSREQWDCGGRAGCGARSRNTDHGGDVTHVSRRAAHLPYKGDISAMLGAYLRRILDMSGARPSALTCPRSGVFSDACLALWARRNRARSPHLLGASSSHGWRPARIAQGGSRAVSHRLAGDAAIGAPRPAPMRQRLPGRCPCPSVSVWLHLGVDALRGLTCWCRAR